ncbi:MAG: hypothetical protein JJ975_13600 [Bacteroidia bacterium]|nr:hypothetical protein [Bacteroidia bacterium]
MQISSQETAQIHLSPSAPESAGASLDFTQTHDSSLWLNYSSIKGGESGQIKNIYVRLADDNLPEGTVITLKASDASVHGQGDMGKALNAIHLSGTNQRLIENIASCYTGEGVGKGRRLTYSLKRGDKYEALMNDENLAVTVSYTIAD